MSQPLPPRGINAKDMQIIFQVLEKLPVWYAKGELTSPSATTWTISANQMYACGLISKKEKKEVPEVWTSKWGVEIRKPQEMPFTAILRSVFFTFTATLRCVFFLMGVFTLRGMLRKRVALAPPLRSNMLAQPPLRHAERNLDFERGGVAAWRPVSTATLQP